MTTVTLVLGTDTSPWTVPTGVTQVTAQVWGAGGGGGGNTLSTDGGSGGGGGAYSLRVFTGLTPGSTINWAIGAGGTAGAQTAEATAGTGGTSWFSSNDSNGCVAVGGVGGRAPTAAGVPYVGGAGGLASSGFGTTKYNGGKGEAGRNSNTGRGGYGGSSAGTGADGWSGPDTWSTETFPAGSLPTGAAAGGNGGTSGAGTAGAVGGGGGGGRGDSAGVGHAGGNGKIVLTYLVNQTVDVDESTETDSASSVGKQKSLAAGASSETDAAQALSSVKTVAVGHASETDAAQTVAGELASRTVVSFSRLSPTRTSSRLYGSFADKIGEQVVAVAAATETDSAQTIAVFTVENRTVVPFSRLTPIRIAGRLTGSFDGRVTEQVIAVTPAIEYNVPAPSIGRIKSVTLVTVGETQYAGPISRDFPRSVSVYSRLGPATVAIRAAGSFNRPTTVAVTAAVETSVASAIGKAKNLALTHVAESDTAVALATNVKVVALTAATETDAAQAVGKSKSKAVAFVAEVDSAQVLDIPPDQLRDVGAAYEVDTAPAIGRVKTVALTAASEAGTAPTIVRVKTRTVSLALEIDAAQPIPWSPKIKRLNPAYETDAAQAVSQVGNVIPIFGSTKSRRRIGAAYLAVPADRVGNNIVYAKKTRIGTGTP